MRRNTNVEHLPLNRVTIKVPEQFFRSIFYHQNSVVVFLLLLFFTFSTKTNSVEKAYPSSFCKSMIFLF